MTRAEAEEIFLTAVLSGESIVVEMSASETQVFRVLTGRMLADMEKKNRPLWLKAREFGIERKEEVTAVVKRDSNRYKMFVIRDGALTPYTSGRKVRESSNFEISDEGGSKDESENNGTDGIQQGSGESK